MLDEPSKYPTVRELEVLRAMIATRKTVAAAHSLGISQPAVSRALSMLESRLKVELFSRESGRLQPTAAAFALDTEAADLFRSLERLSHWPRPIQGGGVLRMAISPTHAQCFLPPLIARFRELEPQTRFEVEIGTGTDVLAAVADRRVHLGMVDAPAVHPAIRCEPIREAIAHVLMPEGHPLCELDTIRPGDLVRYPVIALARRFAARAEADRAFAALGLKLPIVVEATTSAFALELVQAGIGLSLLNPFPLTLGKMEGIAIRPFEPAIRYQTALLFPTDGAFEPASRRFADLIRAEQPEDGVTTPLR